MTVTPAEIRKKADDIRNVCTASFEARWLDDVADTIDKLKAAPKQPIVVDIGQAFAMLQASPKLAAEMTRLVAGPVAEQLGAALAEVERLQGVVDVLTKQLMTPVAERT